MTADWPAALAAVKSSSRKLAAGQVLFQAGDRAEAIYRVAGGCVRLERPSADGRPVTVHVASAGGLFAEAALFSDTYHCDAVAERASEVVVYPKRALLLTLRAHPDLALALTATLAHQLRATRAALEVVRLKTARERVLAFLALAPTDNAGLITLTRPLTLVANEIGLTHEALYRTLRTLHTEGAVERVGRRAFRLGPAGGQATATGIGATGTKSV